MDHTFFMKQALVQAEEALKNGEFPVGCVIVHDNRVIATGARQGTLPGNVNETDHAEITAIRNIPASLSDNKKEMTLYCTLEPCLMCYSASIISGIGTIVYAYEDAMGGGTRADLSKAGPLYATQKPEIIPFILRADSLALFKAFFKNPDNQYWQDSFLEKYTLAQ